MRVAAPLLVLAAALALGAVLWLLYARPRRAAAPSVAAIEPEPTFVTALRPDQTGFEMVVVGQPSISKKTIALQGRLQLFVRPGSQYATWRQFPTAAEFEIVSGPRGRAMLPDRLLSISDSSETYAHYAAYPSNQIVGQDFTFNLFPWGERAFQSPGHYRIVAKWAGVQTAPVDFDLAP